MLAKKLIRIDGQPGSFAASIAYALHGNDNDSPYRGQVVAMRGVPSAECAADAMRIVAKTSRCTDPALHMIVSFGPENAGHDDPAVMRDIVNKMLKSLALAGNQHVAILHRDTQHAHLHVIANRVKDGKAASSAWDVAKLHKAALAINRERGWPLVVSKFTKKAVKEALAANPDLKIAPQRTFGARLSAEADRFRKPSWAHQHHDAIHAALQKADTMADFIRCLMKVGIGMKVHEVHKGLIFYDHAHPDDKALGCKGSAIGLSINRVVAHFNERETIKPVAPKPVAPIRSSKKVEIDHPERDEILEKRRQEYLKFRKEIKLLSDFWLAPERRVKKIKRRFEKRADGAEILRFIADLAKEWRARFDKALALARRLHRERMNAMPVPPKKWKSATVEAMTPQPAATRPITVPAVRPKALPVPAMAPKPPTVPEPSPVPPAKPKPQRTPEQIRAYKAMMARKRGRGR